MAEIDERRTSLARHTVLKNSLSFDESRYEFNDKFIPWDSTRDGSEVHTTAELYNLIKNDSKIEIEGTALAYHPKERRLGKVRVDRNSFLEASERNAGKQSFKEAGFDAFLLDGDPAGSDGFLVGQDVVSFIGGPFYKQLYIYDYLRMHGYCFWAVNHWPMARAAVNIMSDFTLGRGYRVDVHNLDGDPHLKAKMVWEEFEEANDLQDLMHYAAKEISTYGEIMLWWLPDMQSRITYQLSPGQSAPKGLIPRVRLIDPSTVWEIVTYPEDITRVLYYQQIFSTQYQIYTSGNIPSTKFIVQQIPGDQVDHFKINCMSNEKRGRSDLFSALGFMKRLSDSVNYSIIGMQKATAWSLDTTVDGNQADLEAYVQDQQSLGTIPQAGSEFVHTSAIKREYLGNQAASRGGHSPAFEWAFSQAAMALGIPVSYFGTHLSGGQTRASALVATEPVAKRFEMRQVTYEKVLKKLAKRLFEMYGINDAEIEVTMPELLVQDRSAKLKDLALAEAQGWLSKERAATIASKEFNVTEYDYDSENEVIATQGPVPGASGEIAPLTQVAGGSPGDRISQPTAVNSDMRKGLADAQGS